MTTDLIFYGCMVAFLLYSNRRWFFALKETTTINNERTGKTVIKKRRIQKPTKKQAELMEVALCMLGRQMVKLLEDCADKGLNTDSVLVLLNEAGYKGNKKDVIEGCYEYIRAKKHFKL